MRRPPRRAHPRRSRPPRQRPRRPFVACHGPPTSRRPGPCAARARRAAGLTLSVWSDVGSDSLPTSLQSAPETARPTRGGGYGRRVAESITITDNRTGDTLEVPIVNGGVSSADWRKLLPDVF